MYASALLESIEDGKPFPVKNFLNAIRKNGDFSKLPKIVHDLKKMYNKKHGIRDVKVEIARDDKNIISHVKDILKLKQEPEVEIKKDVLGGVVITIDDEVVVDGSIKTRLRKMFK